MADAISEDEKLGLSCTLAEFEQFKRIFNMAAKSRGLQSVITLVYTDSENPNGTKRSEESKINLREKNSAELFSLLLKMVKKNVAYSIFMYTTAYIYDPALVLKSAHPKLKIDLPLMLNHIKQ